MSASGSTWRLAAAGSTGTVGLLTIISALTDDVPWRHDLLLNVEPGPLIAAGHLLTLAAGFALLYLAVAIADRRRRALDTTVSLLAVVGVLHLVKGLDYEEAAVAFGLAALLARGRAACTRGSAVRPVITTAGLGVAAAVYAVLESNVTIPNDDGVHAALVAATVAGLVVALRSWLSPQPAREGHAPYEHERAAAIVARYGRDSLAPFTLRADKAFFFARGGFVAYRTLRETAVVSGDPVCPPGEEAELMAQFLAFANRNGWRVAVAGASVALAALAERLGLRALQVGSEAVVDAGGFTLDGRAIRKVRQAIRRVKRHGWTGHVVVACDLDVQTRDQIAAIEAEFSASRPRVHGFAMSLGRLWGAPEDDDALYAIARDPRGAVAGLIRFVPYRQGLSLDIVRRSPDMPNGVCEDLVVRAIEWAREHGLREVSLNFAGFAHVMAPVRPLTRAERVLALGLGAVHGRFQLERLVVWSNHFLPRWEPRYLLYGSKLELPVSSLRVLQAERYLPARAVPPLTPRWEPARVPPPAVPQLQQR